MPVEDVKKGTEERMKTRNRKPLISDSVMKKLKPGIRAVSKKILAAISLKRGILIRFHNDADGICSGLAIWSIIKPRRVVATQNSSAVYKTESALRDRGILGSSFLPLVILVDFGANEESVEALKLLKEAGIEVIIIDHHPPSEKARKVVDYLLSPFNVGGGSEYTAGYICAEVAKCAGSDPRKMDGLSRISMTGDKSSLYSPKENDMKKALVLDYLSTYKKFPNTLESYGNALKSPALFLSIHCQARDKVEEARRKAKRYTKIKKIGPFSACFVDLDGFTGKDKFPGKGKAIGIVLDELVSKSPRAPLIAIGHGERIINFRVSKKAIKKGFSALATIKKLKKELLTGIESGGGHHAAASMRIKKGFERILLGEIEKMIEAWK